MVFTFPSLAFGFMFCHACHRLHVFPHLSWPSIFPHLPPPSRFPALVAGLTFPRPCHWLHVFLCWPSFFSRLPRASCFSALSIGLTVSRACHQLYFFLLWQPGARSPALVKGCSFNFSRAYHRLHFFSHLPPSLLFFTLTNSFHILYNAIYGCSGSQFRYSYWLQYHTIRSRLWLCERIIKYCIVSARPSCHPRGIHKVTRLIAPQNGLNYSRHGNTDSYRFPCVNQGVVRLLVDIPRNSF